MGKRPPARQGAVTALNNLKVGRSLLATLFHQIEGHFLPVVQAAQASSLNGRNVHENILAAFIGSNKTIAFGGIEPLDGAVGMSGNDPCFSSTPGHTPRTAGVYGLIPSCAGGLVNQNIQPALREPVHFPERTGYVRVPEHRLGH